MMKDLHIIKSIKMAEARGSSSSSSSSTASLDKDAPTVEDLRTCIETPDHILDPIFSNVYNADILDLLTRSEQQSLAQSLNIFIEISKNFNPPNLKILHGLKVAQIFVNHITKYVNMKQNIYGLMHCVAMYSKEYNKKIYFFGEDHRQFLDPSRRITAWMDKYIRNADKIIDIFIEVWYTIPKTSVPDQNKSNLFIMYEHFIDCLHNNNVKKCPVNVNIHPSDIRDSLGRTNYLIFFSYLLLVRQDKTQLDILILNSYDVLFKTKAHLKKYVDDIFNHVKLDDLIKTISISEHRDIIKNKVLAEFIYQRIDYIYENDMFVKPNSYMELSRLLIEIFTVIPDIYCMVQFLRTYENGYTPHYAFSIWGGLHTKQQSYMLSLLGFKQIYETTFFNLSAYGGVMIPFSEEKPFEWEASLSHYKTKYEFTIQDMSSIATNPSLLSSVQFKFIHDIPSSVLHYYNKNAFIKQTLLKNLSQYLYPNVSASSSSHKRARLENDDIKQDDNVRIFKYDLAVAQMLYNAFHPLKKKPIVLDLGAAYYLTSASFNKYIYIIGYDSYDSETNHIPKWFNTYLKHTNKLIDVFVNVWRDSNLDKAENAPFKSFINQFSSCFNHQKTCPFHNVRMHYANVFQYLMNPNVMHTVGPNDTMTTSFIYKFIYLLQQIQLESKAEYKQSLIDLLKQSPDYFDDPLTLYNDVVYLFTRNKTWKQVLDPTLRNFIIHYIIQMKYSTSELIDLVEHSDYSFIKHYMDLFMMCNLYYVVYRILRHFSDGTTCKYAFILASTDYAKSLNNYLTNSLDFTTTQIEKLSTTNTFPI